MFHVKPSDWWRQYYRVRNACQAYEKAPGPNQIRRARCLLALQPRSGWESSGEPGDPRRVAIEYLEEVVQYGNTAFREELESRKAQARMGSERRDLDWR